MNNTNDKKNVFNFCPECGNKSIDYLKNIKWVCKNCGFTLYKNIASAVAIIIIDKDKNILFEKRAKDPAEGLLDLPGGFCSQDESAEDAVIRECKEELGVTLQNIKYLCSYPNDYEYKNIAYKTCDLFFTLKINGTIQKFIKTLNPQKSEVKALTAYKITSLTDVENLPLAFVSARNALKFMIGNFEKSAAFLQDT